MKWAPDRTTVFTDPTPVLMITKDGFPSERHESRHPDCPFFAGAIYDRAGYYAVFADCLGVVAFDYVLRVLMIGKGKAANWLGQQRIDRDWVANGNSEETQAL